MKYKQDEKVNDWVDGLILTIEHGHICLRNHVGWLVWGKKIENMSKEGYNLRTILDKAWKDEGK